jgi:NodT family efflux transporter outer membrane factor (OMF) lipoprotein
MSPIPLRWTLCMTALGLMGCAASVPDRPHTERLLAGTYAAALPDHASPLDPSAWQALWDDAALQNLLTRAANANLDGRMAWERVQQARAGWTQLRSSRLPQVDLEGTASDERTGLPAAVKQGQPDTQAVRLGVNLGWALDLWGAVDAAAQAGEHDALAAQAGWYAARWTAQHEVAHNYLIWQGARLQIELLAHWVELEREAERITERRLGAGMATAMDAANRRADVQQAASQLPALRTLQAVTEHHLALLLGERPGTGLPELEGAPKALPVAKALPVGLPIELIQRRPDLIVAEQQLLAETQRLRVADAERWPQLLLGAVLGGQDLRLNGLGLSPARFSNVGLAFTLPLFNAGRLKAAVDLQAARQRGATRHYEKTLLQALADVENSLVAWQQQQQGLQYAEAMVSARTEATRRGARLQEEGQIDPLQHIGLQRAELGARLAHTDARLAIALGSLQLYRALGGGWATDPGPLSVPVTVQNLVSTKGQP